MIPEKFSNEEWQEILDEFRLLVAQAGFADWDSAAANCLAEPDADFDDKSIAAEKPYLMPHAQLYYYYVKRFLAYLNVDTYEARKHRRLALDALLRTEDGGSVELATVDIGGRILAIDSGEPTDAMIARLSLFLEMISGGGDGYLDETPETLP